MLINKKKIAWKLKFKGKLNKQIKICKMQEKNKKNTVDAFQICADVRLNCCTTGSSTQTHSVG